MSLASENLTKTHNQPLNTLANEIKTTLSAIERHDEKGDGLRLRLCLMLRDAKTRVDAGEGGGKWEKWCKENITKSPGYIRECVRIARTPNPADTLRRERQESAIRAQAARDRAHQSEQDRAARKAEREAEIMAAEEREAIRRANKAEAAAAAQQPEVRTSASEPEPEGRTERMSEAVAVLLTGFRRLSFQEKMEFRNLLKREPNQ
jgi:hypothetical protein